MYKINRNATKSYLRKPYTIKSLETFLENERTLTCEELEELYHTLSSMYSQKELKIIMGKTQNMINLSNMSQGGSSIFSKKKNNIGGNAGSKDPPTIMVSDGEEDNHSYNFQKMFHDYQESKQVGTSGSHLIRSDTYRIFKQRGIQSNPYDLGANPHDEFRMIY